MFLLHTRQRFGFCRVLFLTLGKVCHVIDPNPSNGALSLVQTPHTGYPSLPTPSDKAHRPLSPSLTHSLSLPPSLSLSLRRSSPPRSWPAWRSSPPRSEEERPRPDGGRARAMARAPGLDPAAGGGAPAPAPGRRRSSPMRPWRTRRSSPPRPKEEERPRPDGSGARGRRNSARACTAGHRRRRSSPPRPWWRSSPTWTAVELAHAANLALAARGPAYAGGRPRRRRGLERHPAGWSAAHRRPAPGGGFFFYFFRNIFAEG